MSVIYLSVDAFISKSPLCRGSTCTEVMFPGWLLYGSVWIQENKPGSKSNFIPQMLASCSPSMK